MKKRTMALLLAGAMTTTVFTGCSKQSTTDTTAAPKTEAGTEAKTEGEAKTEAPTEEKKAVALNVMTTFAGEDGNAPNYQKACLLYTSRCV